MSEEIWKEIAGSKGQYLVSNHGRVKSVRGKGERILSQQDRNGRGSMSVTLCHEVKGGKTYYVARLVAEAFVDTVKPGYKVYHVDNDPLNNRADNLEVRPTVKIAQIQRQVRKALRESLAIG